MATSSRDFVRPRGDVTTVIDYTDRDLRTKNSFQILEHFQQISVGLLPIMSVGQFISLLRYRPSFIVVLHNLVVVLPLKLIR